MEHGGNSIVGKCEKNLQHMYKYFLSDTHATNSIPKHDMTISYLQSPLYMHVGALEVVRTAYCTL